MGLYVQTIINGFIDAIKDLRKAHTITIANALIYYAFLKVGEYMNILFTFQWFLIQTVHIHC
jgi:hypothetical protein